MCSIRISLSAAGDIRLDNQIKIEGYLEEKGLLECNPTQQPITKNILEELYQNKKDGLKADEEEQQQTRRFLGQAEWISQTTHPTIAPAVSMLSSLKEYKGGLEAMKHLFRYLKGKAKFALIKKADNDEGLSIHSDSDWGGLFTTSLGQELRSRTGIIITYNGMPVTWKSYRVTSSNA